MSQKQPAYTILDEIVASLPSPEIKHFATLQTLGTGGFGTVVRAIHEHTGLEVAVKEVNIKQLEMAKQLSSLKRELDILNLQKQKDLSSLVKFFGCFGTPSTLYFVSEIALCDLVLFRQVFQQFPPVLFKLLVCQLVNGLAEMHLNGYSHRDMKPGNVLFCSDLRFKLTDFGTAKKLQPEELKMIEGQAPYRSLTEVIQDEKIIQQNRMTFVGTERYQAPEQVNGTATLQTPIDAWGLGALIFEAFTGKPFDGPQVLNDKRFTIPADVKQLLERLLNEKPEKRLEGGWKSIKKLSIFIGVDPSSKFPGSPQFFKQAIFNFKNHLDLPKLAEAQYQFFECKAVESFNIQMKSYLQPNEVIVFGVDLDSIIYLMTNQRVLIVNQKKATVVQHLTIVPPFIKFYKQNATTLVFKDCSASQSGGSVVFPLKNTDLVGIFTKAFAYVKFEFVRSTPIKCNICDNNTFTNFCPVCGAYECRQGVVMNLKDERDLWRYPKPALQYILCQVMNKFDTSIVDEASRPKLKEQVDFGSLFSATVETQEAKEETVEQQGEAKFDYPMLFKVDEQGNIVPTGVEVDFTQIPKLKVDYAL